MRLDEYAALDGLELARLVREKHVSAAEVTDAAFEAIARMNQRLNFLVAETRAEAQASLNNLPGEAAFRGVPLLIKDVALSVAGFLQEMGSRLALGLMSNEDGELAKRYRRAGFVFVGRSATPEFGACFTTESVLNGPTLNPWDVRRSPGGSSGGAAAAVAAGVVPLAHGGDMGGSIRIPAHCCGVFGLKPTRGRNPLGPQSGGLGSGLAVPHVITRTVRDSAAALDATAGADVGCDYTAPPPSGTFLAAVLRPPRKLRIAFSTVSPHGSEVSPEVAGAVLKSAALCESLGHIVEPTSPQIDGDGLLELLAVIASAGIFHLVRKLEAATGRKAGPENLEGASLALALRGSKISAHEYLAALDGMNRFNRKLGHFFEDYDVLIMPTMAHPALPLGTINSNQQVEDVMQYMLHEFRLAPFTVPFNATGQPAMSVPLHQSADGLPIGTQFIGRFADEETLLSLAGQLEAASPWIGRYPPLSIRQGQTAMQV